MAVPIKVLIVEDSEDDAEFLLRELRHGEYDPEFIRVDSPRTMREALQAQDWDIILSDYYMPGFSALTALQIVHDLDVNIPFIVITGATGEDIAVEAMRAGAHDYLLKHNLRRLVSAVKRELLVAKSKKSNSEHQNQISNERNLCYEILNSVAAPILVINREARIICFNNESEKLTGLDATQVIGTLPWETVFPNGEQNWFESILANADENFSPFIKHHETRSVTNTLISVPWKYNLVKGEQIDAQYLVATAMTVDKFN